MNGIILNYAESETPVVSKGWRGVSDVEWKRRITYALGRTGYAMQIRVLHVGAEGQVTVAIDAMPAAARGQLLLEVEQMLMQCVDIGLRLYLTPIQDRNRLRVLRGTPVKELY